MDSRVQKAMELDALKALTASAESSARTLEIVLARLDKTEEALAETLRLIGELAAAKSAPANPKGR